MPATVTARELRACLAELAVAASHLARGRERTEAQRMLAEAIRSANRALGLRPVAADPADADALVRDYIEAGGDWRALANAVNRHAFEGATRSASPHPGPLPQAGEGDVAVP